MSLASDLSALAIARATKAALSASLPPCGCGGTSWIGGSGGALLCAGCSSPAPMGDNASARVTPSPSTGQVCGGEGGEGVGKGVEPNKDVVPPAVAVAGPSGGAGAGSANPAMLVVTDPDGSGGGPHFSSVTNSRSTGSSVSASPVGTSEVFHVEHPAKIDPMTLGDADQVGIPVSSGGSSVPARPVAASSQVEVGVLRGRVQKQRKGTVEFYEDAKAAHRMSMRSMKSYIRKKLKQPGGVLEAMQDPAYRWCVEQVGKFAHSQAPREIKAETKLLIEVDLG